MGLFLSEINKKIKESLEDRMDLKKKRDAKSIHTRSTWTRMWSTSDKETIISGGLLKGKEHRSGFSEIYSPKSKTGNSYRPIPGIEDVNAKYQGDFGSTRTCTIAWRCWSFEDIDKLQPLFLTHGKTVVIEWGWSTGDKKQTIGLDSSRICNVYKDSKFIKKKVIKSGGNFDAMIGLVTGWDWAVQDDGSIKCMTTIIAHGANALDMSIKQLEAQSDGDKEQLLTYVENIYARLKDLGDEYGPTKDGAASKYVSEDEAYVNWAFIEDEIITKHISMETGGGVKLPVMKSVSYDSDGKEIGPTLIYRPPKLENIKGDILRVKASSPFKSFEAKKNNGAPIRNLVLNVKVVKDAFENVETLSDGLESLFKVMNSAACEIWDFRLVSHEEKPGQFGVVDTNWGENRVKAMKKKAFIFPTWNSNSIVRDQTLSATLPDAMAMSVMYGTNKPKNATADTDDPQAQKAAEKLAEGGPEDDCLKNPEGRKNAKEVKVNENSGTNASTTNPEQNLKDGSEDRVEEESTDEKKTDDEQKKICKKVNNQKIKQVDMIYPVELSLTVDGIAGLQWGNAVHTAFIPKVYKDNVVFQVTAIDHKIDQGDWETTINTVCRIATE